jgi:hypothetical protein
MNDAILKTTYEDIVITYWESDDTWRFELRGRDRKADSLAKAKELIDKPAPQEKTFKPIEVLFCKGYENSTFTPATVTSIADAGWRGGTHVWISCNGSRSKESTRDLYAVCPENDALIAEIAAIQAKSAELDEQEKVAKSKLKNAQIEP